MTPEQKKPMPIVVELGADPTGIMEALDKVAEKIDLVSKKMNDLREAAKEIANLVAVIPNLQRQQDVAQTSKIDRELIYDTCRNCLIQKDE